MFKILLNVNSKALIPFTKTMPNPNLCVKNIKKGGDF